MTSVVSDEELLLTRFDLVRTLGRQEENRMKKLVLLVALLAFVVAVPMAMAADAPAAAAKVCCKDKKADASAKDEAACTKAGGKWMDAKDCK
jgi:hypothetical protein